MSLSPLIRRVAAVVVAIAIPFAGAATAQASSYDSPHFGQNAAHHVAFKPYEPYRSSWS